MKTRNNRQSAPTKSLAFIGALIIAAAAMIGPIYSVRSSSKASRSVNQPKADSVDARSMIGSDLMRSGSANYRSFSPALVETIGTYASDCTTPKTAFVLGETVCAVVNGVTETDRFVNWLSPPSSTVVSSSATIPDSGPHSYSYLPTVAGTWKATIADPTDSSIIPTIFTVVAQSGSIQTYASDCTTPKVSFDLGETVCAKITGQATTNRKIGWVSPYGSLAQGANITTDPQTGTYLIPATATQTFTDVGGGTTVVDNRGVWKLGLYSALDGSFVEDVNFTVHDPAKKFVDLSVSQDATSSEQNVGAGSGSVFRIFIVNHGPDTATSVVLTDTVPTNTTFTSALEVTGFGFTCGLPVGTTFTCTAATLPVGATAEISFAYDVDTGTPEGTILTNVASVASSDTPCLGDPCELTPGDNTSSQDAKVPTTPGAETCTLVCHANFSVVANTTQGGNPGAIVTFNAASQAGSCGIITATFPGLPPGEPASGAFYPVGTTVVSVTSATGGGSCSFTITVVQATPPTISCPPNVSGTDDGGGFHTFTAAQIQPPGTPTTNPSTNVVVTFVRSDNVEAIYDSNGMLVTPAVVHSLIDPYPLGSTDITWTVTDANGLSASCTQTVTVHAPCSGSDAEPPTITAPPDITTATGPDSTTCGVALDDELGEPQVNDDCSATFTVSGIPPGNLFPIGTTILTYTATDGAGHTASDTQTVTVTDNTPPVIFAPANASYTCPEEVPALSPSQAFGPDFTDDNINNPGPVFDNCGSPIVTASQTTSGVGSTASPRIITRTYSALDTHGNTASAVQVITVTDGTPPTITAPPDVIAFTGAGATSCDTVVSNATLGSPTAQDNCAGVTVSRSPSGNTFPVGVTTVVWTATDWAGNTATASQTVTVNDNTPPVINCPAPLILEPTCPTGAIGTWTAPVGTDNCPGATTTQTAGQASGTVFPIGMSTVIYTANDAHGNSASCSFTVTVLTPQAVIQNLINSVNASSLTGTQKNGLLAKLNAALTAINGGGGNACAKLSDFVNSVGTLISHGDLTAAQGNAWILSANHVRNTIGCTNDPCS